MGGIYNNHLRLDFANNILIRWSTKPERTKNPSQAPASSSWTHLSSRCCIENLQPRPCRASWNSGSKYGTLDELTIYIPLLYLRP